LGGFLHSDPHSANAFVRPVIVNGVKRPQLVLLDHGLYRDLTPEFRDNYARLWRALVVRDSEQIEKYAKALGAGDYYKIFAFILTFRPMSNRNVGLGKKLTADDWEQVKREWEEIDPNISKLLEQLDRQLLMVLRSANILRGINVELGSSVNRFLINARSAVKGIHLREGALRNDAPWRKKWTYWWDLLNLELTFLYARVWQYFNSFFQSEKYLNFEA
jgi:aarF domain-containing kinase